MEHELIEECTECTGDLVPKPVWADYTTHYQCVECGTKFDRKLIEG